MMKRFVPLIIGLLVAIAAVLWFFFAHQEDLTPPSERAPKEVAPAPSAAARPESDEAPPQAPRVSVDDDPAGALRLEGQVVDADEHPVAGATVVLSSNPKRRVTTEADGSFVFDKLIGRTYSLAARKGDQAAESVTVRLTDKTEPVILRLRRGGGVEVTVVDAKDRKPIAGAKVELRALAETSGTTGADGKVTLRGIAGGWHVLRASKDGYAPGTRPFQTDAREDTTESETIELRAGAEVTGRVVGPDGAAVANAAVLPIDTGTAWSFGDDEEDSVRTDSGGRFTIPALPAGTFRLEASHKDFARGSSPPLKLDGKTARADVVITLGAGAEVAGTVVDQAGQPISGATLRVAVSDARAWFESTTRQAYSDEKGRFAIKGLPRDKVQLVAMAESASSETVPLDLGATPKQTDLVVKLSIDGSIDGLVVSEKGEPIPEAQVSAYSEDLFGDNDQMAEMRLRGPAQDTADSGGRFQLRGLRPGSYRIRASRPGAGESSQWMRRGTTAKTGDKEVKVVCPDDGRVKGRVLFADGSAPELFTIAVGFGSGKPFTGTRGEFSLQAPAGKMALQVSGPDFVKKVVANLEVEPGKDLDAGTITVEKGRSISGRVMAGNGSPVAGAKVMCGPQLIGSGSELSEPMFASRMGIRSATSGDDGSYVISGVGPKHLVCGADHGDAGRSTIVAVTPGAGSVQVDLTLRPFGSLEGKVLRAGQPVPSLMVMANPESAIRATYMVRTGPDGGYRFERLVPDAYVLTVMDPSGMGGGGASEMQSKRITVGLEQAVKLDIQLPDQGVEITVGVAGKDGAQISGAQVFFVTGKVSATTVDEFMEHRGEGTTLMGFVLKGKPVKLGKVAPGSYSACVIPFPGEIDDMSAMMALQDKLDQLFVVCTPQTVKAEPAAQTITVTSPPPPVLK